MHVLNAPTLEDVKQIIKNALSDLKLQQAGPDDASFFNNKLMVQYISRHNTYMPLCRTKHKIARILL